MLSHVRLGGGVSTSRRERRKGRSHGLTDQKRQEIKEAFELFDTNGLGTINAKEPNVANEGSWVGDDRGANKVDDCRCDKDGSGTIYFDEFVHMMTLKIGERDTREVDESFSADHIYEMIDGAVKISTNGFSHTSRGCSNYRKLLNKMLKCVLLQGLKTM